MAKQQPKEFIQLRHKVPAKVHKQLVAHQKFMNLKSKHDVTLEEASIDLLKRGIETLMHLNQ